MSFFARWFLMYCCMLSSGWFRQCDIISHSKDVDIGIWIKDYNPLLLSEFEKSGLHLKHRFGRVSPTIVWFINRVDI